jgi:translation initiation factor IF-2
MGHKKKSKQSPKVEIESARLEIVLKCDVAGTVEAVRSGLEGISVPGVEIQIIQAGIGNITKSDVLMALTASRFILGFNVDTMPKLTQMIKEKGVEVRLYDTIYNLTASLEKIAGSLAVKAPTEKITGRAKVIATFKSSRKGAIIGCEILAGSLEIGNNFRVITAMGPAYSGKITSLQIEGKNVQAAKAGQQVGLQIPDWKKAKVEDLVECYEIIQPDGGRTWRPHGGVFRSTS